MLIFLILFAVFVAIATIYFASKSREFRIFLAGAFLVSGGVQLYLSMAKVSVPLLGTSFVQTPELSAARSTVHFLLFLVCLYFGVIKKPRRQKNTQR